jgi:Ca2+-binding RTX toxin-like protein
LVTSKAGSNQLWSGAGNDQLYALGGHNYINADTGDDTIYSNGGYNTIDGGAGFDVVRYDYAPSNVFASLDLPSTQNAGAAFGDTYVSIEGLIGSAFDDTLVTTAAGHNQLWGGSGNDQLYGLGGHNDINAGDGNDSIFSNGGSNAIDGGSGLDLARYDYASTGVVAALDPSASAYNTGAAAGDTYTAVEGLVGSPFSDILFGDAGSNQLYGQNGNDFLIGNAGDDVLFGGAGANELLGGAGNDAFDFYAFELQADIKNTIDDFSFAAGNTDHLYLFGVSSGNVSFTPLATGTNINIATGGGTATIFAANASLANVQSHTSFI